MIEGVSVEKRGKQKKETDLETCSQRGALGFASLKATSISDLILSKAIVSSLGHRFAAEFRSPSSLCSAFDPSDTAAEPPSAFSVAVSGKVEISSIGYNEITATKLSKGKVKRDKKKKEKKTASGEIWGKKGKG